MESLPSRRVNDMEKKINALFSLCMKAGKLTTGEFSCEQALRQNIACLVVVTEDASDNTKKKFINKAFFYQVPVLTYGKKQELSRCVGKENRAVYVITEKNLAKRVQEMIDAHVM